MKFLDRMALLVKADAHGVIDQLEERSLLLKQHLREAELELDRKRARVDALCEQEKSQTGEGERLAERVRALDEDVELALVGGKDDLARFSARKLLPARDALAELRTRTLALASERDAVAAVLREQEAAFEELKGRVRVQLAAARARDEAPDLGWLGDAPVADEDVELELLRRRTANEEVGR